MTEAGVSLGHLPHGPDLFSPSLDDLHLPYRAQEVKESPFFHSLDWQMVFLQKVTVGGRGRLRTLQPLHRSDAQPPFCRSTLPR